MNRARMNVTCGMSLYSRNIPNFTVTVASNTTLRW